MSIGVELSRLGIVVAVLFAVACSGTTEGRTQTQMDAGPSFDGNVPDLRDDGFIVDSGKDAQVGDAQLSCGSPGEIYRARDLALLVDCERLSGSLELVNFFETSVPQASSLSAIEEELVIFRAPSLEALSDFSRLEVVGGGLTLEELTALSEGEGMAKLKTVEGKISLRDLPIDSLRFPELERAGGLDIIDLPNVDSLAGLKKLEAIDGDLRIAVAGIDEAELMRFLQNVQVSGSVELNGERLRD